MGKGSLSILDPEVWSYIPRDQAAALGVEEIHILVSGMNILDER